jgi:hypothetical protein
MTTMKCNKSYLCGHKSCEHFGEHEFLFRCEHQRCSVVWGKAKCKVVENTQVVKCIKKVLQHLVKKMRNGNGHSKM